MSDTFKTDKRGRVVLMMPRSPGQKDAIYDRHGFGMSEKILRRNRKTWTHLFAKRGRVIDKREIREQAP